MYVKDVNETRHHSRAAALLALLPHVPHLGRCGAHFVGVNARSVPWSYCGRPGVPYLQDHWCRWRDEVADRVGV